MRFVSSLLGLCFCACVAEEVPTGPLSDCDPLDPALCALPFPSSHFLVDDETAPSGRRVNYGPESLPINRDLVKLDPYWWNQRDGFSINSAAIAYFENVTRDGTIPSSDIGAYLSDDAKTVIIDTVTGERVPHWFELDDTAPPAAESDIERHVTVSILRPAVPYEWSRRYVVGIRGLVDDTGQLIEASPAFASLRDGLESTNQDVTFRRAHFEDEIFPVLEAQGFARDELLLAWDFETASRENTLGSLEHMRDDALSQTDEGGPEYVIEEIDDRDCDEEGELIARHVEGYFIAPNYTTEDRPSTFLALDDQGLPVANLERQVPFMMRVPCSVARGFDGSGPAPESAAILQYGHGLLGSKGEARSSWLAQLANDHGYVILAQDWTGFSTPDSVGISLMVALDPSDFAFIPQRSQQGMIEFVLGMRMASGDMASDPAMSFDGVSVIDPERRYYYGNSQGGIMGSAYLAMSPDVTRGVLGVGGAPYSLLLPRSVDFDPFFLTFKEKYLDHREISLFVVGLTQQVWDPVEPGGWMWDMVRDAADPKQVLMQVAIKDNQVTTLGAHYQARAYGAKTIAPAVRDIWGVEESAEPWTGSGLVEFLYSDLEDEPALAVPPSGEDPHECPRREPAGMMQVGEFFADGVIRNYCDGPCVSLKENVCP